MSWAAWIIACRRTRGFQAVLLGACLLVAWDLLLDPAMSRVTSYWIWAEKGNYYGMPWANLVGWAITGFVLLAMLRKLAPEPEGDLRFSIFVYLVNFLLPLGFCVLNGYWIAVFAGIGGRSGGVSSFWFREGVPPAAGFDQRNYIPNPGFPEGCGPGLGLFFHARFAFEDEIQSMLH